MALTEQVILDIQAAERQITVLEGQLAGLGTPINVPVSVTGEQDLVQVRQNLGQSEDAVAGLNRELNQTDQVLDRVGREANDASDAVLRVGTRGVSAFTTLRNSLLGVSAAFLAIQGARLAFDFAGDAIQSASNLEQSIGAVDAVFGELGESVRDFGETADQSVGLAASQFNQLAALLGSQLQTFGFSARDAAAETQRLITLSSDLAATFGGPVSDAVNAISSLLRGEVNPIERYGVAMNEALVAAKALELGLAATTAALTLQDKTLARLAILTEQTANAQGQFGRESETTAGRLERIRAEFENTRAEIGEALVPAFQKLLDITPVLISVFEDGLVPAINSISGAIAGVDTEGFTRTIAGLPSAVSTAFSQIGDGAGFLVNTFQGLGDLLRFDVTPAFENFTQAGADLNNIGLSGTFNRAIQNLLTTLASGRPRVQSFADTLAELARTSELGPSDLTEIATQLQNIAQLSPGELRDVRDAIFETGAAAGFSAPEVAFLVRTLDELQRAAQVTGADRNFPLMEALAGTIGAAATQIPPSVAIIDESLSRLRESTGEPFDISNIQTAFSEALPEALSGAAAALRDEEGEIVEDFGTFMDNLQGELDKRIEFEQNLDLLDELGLDELEQAFRDAGIESAPALADGLNDPGALAAANAKLEDAARAMAQAETEAFVEDVRTFIDSFDPIEMPIVLIPDFSELTRITTQVPGAVSGAETGAPRIETTVVIESPGVQSTDAARVAQAVNGVITANLR